MAVRHYLPTTHDHLMAHRRAKHSKWIVRQGAGSGFVAGIIFALGEMIYSWITGGQFIEPLRMMASVPLQESATSISTGMALLVGGLFLLAVSVVMGIIGAFFIANMRSLHMTKARLVTFASLFGLVFWVVNYYVLGSMVSGSWFYSESNQIAQLLLHVFLYGTMLGLYLDNNPPLDSISE